MTGDFFMKIAVIGPTYPVRGGISHYTTLLAENLAERNEVFVFSLEKFYKTFFYKGREAGDFSRKAIKCKKARVSMKLGLNPLSWLSAGFKLSKQNFGLVVFEWWHVFLYPIYWTVLLGLGKKARKVFICHNVLPHEHSFLAGFFAKRMLKRADKVIVNSKEEFEYLRTFLPGSKIILGFLPLLDFSSGLKAPKSLKSRRVLFFGFVRKYKGLAYLIEAMPKVLEKVPVELWIVGEFWESKQKYLELISSLGIGKSVKIVDRYVSNEEIPGFFQNSSIVALPYVSATQSSIVQLAYEFNKPVIASKVGGLPDVIVEGKTGYLVKPKDSAALSNALIKFFKSGKEKEFSKNISKFKKKFGWERLVRMVEGV